MFKGYYINLKESYERNNFIQKQLKDLNIDKKYNRLEAIKGSQVFNNYKTKLNEGSLGCWLSHEKVLTLNKNTNEHLHILEDDARLSSALMPTFKAFESKVDWDIIFTDVYFSMLSPSNFYKIHEKYKLFKEKKQISLINLFGLPFNGTTSYFVNKNSIEKLDNLVGRDYNTTIKHDTRINNLVQQKKLKAYLTVPFLTSISNLSDNSTIDETYNTNLLAMDFIRKSFFINSNTEKILKETKKTQGLEDDDSVVDIYTTSTKIILNNLHNKRHMKSNKK